MGPWDAVAARRRESEPACGERLSNEVGVEPASGLSAGMAGVFSAGVRVSGVGPAWRARGCGRRGCVRAADGAGRLGLGSVTSGSSGVRGTVLAAVAGVRRRHDRRRRTLRRRIRRRPSTRGSSVRLWPSSRNARGLALAAGGGRSVCARSLTAVARQARRSLAAVAAGGGGSPPLGALTTGGLVAVTTGGVAFGAAVPSLAALDRRDDSAGRRGVGALTGGAVTAGGADRAFRILRPGRRRRGFRRDDDDGAGEGAGANRAYHA